MVLAQTLLCFALLGQPAPLPPLVGTLSVTEGKVRFERKSRDPEWAEKYVRLRVGDKLTIVEKPRATVTLDATREVWRLPETGAWEVQPRGLKVLGGGSPVLLRRGTTRQQPSGKPPKPLAGIIRGDGSSLEPFGAVLSAPLEITWTRAPSSTKTTLEVLDSAGKKIWSKAATGTKLALPASVAKPGVWLQVRVTQSGGGVSASTSTWVRLLPVAERQPMEGEEKALRSALADEPVALGLALGDLWASVGLVSRLPKALELAFPAFIARPKPESEVVRAWHWKHGEWLETAGFGRLARAEYERAWKAGERAAELKSSVERLGGKPEIEEWEQLAAERDRLMGERKYAEALPVAQSG